MPRRTYAPRNGRHRPTGASPEALAALAEELQRRARWRQSEDDQPNPRRDAA